MTNERQLRERIMRRVWGIYVLRQLTSPALRLGAMAAIAVTLISSVSLKHIVENALSVSGPLGLARFSLYAVIDTSFFVQVLMVLAAALGVWFITDAVRNATVMRASA